MKKLFALAMIAALATAGAAMASPSFIAPNATFGAGSPSTTNNDDSCDISNVPAATLLLPVFEVDFNSPSTTAVNTLFTVTNTSDLPQIAHITVWTDFSYPVLDFNIFLTGYDVQSISMYDILNRGVIDEVLRIGNETAFRTAREAARLEGIAVGISSGAALAAGYEVAARPEMSGKTIVVVLPDQAERYLSTPLFDGV